MKFNNSLAAEGYWLVLWKTVQRWTAIFGMRDILAKRSILRKSLVCQNYVD